MKLLSVIIRVTLIAMVVLTPWMFGGVWARTQWALLLITSVLLAADLLSRFGKYDQTSWMPTSWLPLLFGIAIGVAQLVPMSTSWANALAPESSAIRKQFDTPAVTPNQAKVDAAALLQSSRAPDKKITRSVYPAATREYLSLLVLATACFILASTHAIDRKSIRSFFIGITVCGALLSFFGIVQRLSWNGKFYWFIETTTGSFTSFGPFVNRNNAGGFLNMCLAIGIGLLLSMKTEALPELSKPRRRKSSGESQPQQSRSRPGNSTKSGETPIQPVTRSEAKRSASDETKASEAPSSSSPATSDLPDPATDSRAAKYADMFASDPKNATSNDQSDSTENDSPRDVADTGFEEASSKSSSSKGTAGRSRNRIKVREKVRERVRVRKSEIEPKTEPANTRERFEASARTSNYGGTSRRKPLADRLGEATTNFFSTMNAEKLWILAFITFIIGGILCTASRGSILALIAATIFTSAALAGKSGNRAFAGGLLALLLVGGGLMSWAGQSEFVQERFAQMFDPDMSERGRVPNWNEALDTVPNNWAWGTGLGTYRFVYERFQNRFLGQTAHYHAENQFLQALIEGGALSLILLVAAIVLTSWSVYKLFKFGGNLNNALAVAGTFALSSQFIGGMFDFGLYIPSNTILMASICGIVIGRAALISLIGNAESFEQAEQANDGRNLASGPTPELSHDLNEAQSLALSGGKTLPANVTNRRVARSYAAQLRDVAVRVRVPWLAMPTTIGILLLGCLFGSLEMHKAALVEQAIHGSPLLIVREIEEPETVRSVIQPLATALNQRYDDAVGHRHMGELLQHLYRAETYQNLMAAEPSLVMQMRSSTTSSNDNEEGLSPAENPLNTSDRIVDLWQKADMWHLHGTVRSLEREGNSEARNALLDRPSVEEILKPASRHMLLARHFCPTIPHVHYALAELSVVPGAEPNEELHLQRAKALSPGDATLHYWSGVLNMNSKKTDQAIADWNASLSQTGLHLNEIMEGSKGKLTLGTILREVIPPRADLLLTVARRKELSVPSRKKVQRVFLQHAAEALPMTDLPAGQHAYTAGTIYRLLGRLDEAEEQFEVAIRHDPDHTGWLYQYTLTLFELGRLDEALEQANRLTQIRQHPSYSKLKRNIIQKQAEGGSFHPTAMTSAP